MITIKTVRDLLHSHFGWDLKLWIYKNDSCAEHPPTVIKRNVLRAEIDNDEIMDAEVEQFDLNYDRVTGEGGLNIFVKETTMNKYFCNTCGLHFESKETENITCSNCGAYDIYPDTAEGAAQSVKDLTAYENKQAEWEE